MISSVLEWLRQLFGGALPWVVVPPWCIGVRVRLGRDAVALAPGFYFRVPLLDQVSFVNTRQRFVSGQPVTITSGRVGYVRVRCAVAGFTIVDPLRAMLSFDQLEQAVQALLVIATSRYADPAEARAALNAKLSDCGVRVDSVEYAEDAEVRAFKIMQNDCGIWQATRDTSVF